MKSFFFKCPECDRTAPIVLSEPFVRTSCPSCNTPVSIDVFPALVRGHAVGQLGERVITDEESSCFYHPAKRAVVPCESCGRFLCALCDIELNGRHLCSACVESGVAKEKLTQLKREYVHYDDIALALAIVPMLVFYLTPITAFVTLYMIIRYRKHPLSVIPRRRWRFYVAGSIALLQIAGWTAGIIAWVTLGGMD